MFDYNNTFSSFSTNDLDKTEQFYKNILDLMVEKLSMGVLSVETKDGQRFMIYPKPNHEPATYTVFNFRVKDIKAAVEALTGQGVKFEQYDGQIKTDEKGIAWSNGQGPNIAWFKDPGGNIIAIIEE